MKSKFSTTIWAAVGLVGLLGATAAWQAWAGTQSADAESGQVGACCSPSTAPRAAIQRFEAPPVDGAGAASPHADAVDRRDPAAGPAGMVWIPGGEFRMGSQDPLARLDESPVHVVRVSGFWMDVTEVTNAQFRAFVEATGYRTVAERAVDWEELKKQLPPGTPKPPEEKLLPGSLVFTPLTHPVHLQDCSQWWRWVTGACWKHPEGPGSTIDGRDKEPVVQVAYEDALAYCKWAGKRLPTEAEWEYAARGGLLGKVNVWGDEPVSPIRCNIWDGEFPHRNTAADGFTLAAPVKSYPPNGYGLYDMAGNVWEWCSDLYHERTYSLRLAELGDAAVAVDPTGAKRSYDSRNRFEPVLRVIRGGSFLCNDSYCASYRPSARMATAPDTGLSHLGFRCVADASPARP